MNLSLRDIDDQLVKDKWPPISDWWWMVITLVYASMLRNVVIRVGRRGGKSSTIVGRIAIHEVLSEKHIVPPGDMGYFAIISADKDQAQERLDTCHKALKALSIAHRKTANEITLTDRNVGIKCFAATTSAVVSFTCIGFICDEMARWKDRETGENPAKQIVTSLRATMLTMPNAIGWFVSAPWSTLDEHHAMVSAGTNESQMVFEAPTWVANPTITEAMTHALEPDQPSWEREYAAIPMASDETKFFAAAFIDAAASIAKVIDTAVNKIAPPKVVRTTAGADFAFRRNSSALAVLQNLGAKFRVARVEERVPGSKALVPSATITDLCGIAAEYGADSVACDLHYIESVRETTDTLEMPLLEFPSDSDGIAKAYIRTRVLLSEGRLDLTQAMPKLIAQLKETTSQPTVTGLTIRNKVVDGAHGDLVSALVCAVWAADQPPMPRDPLTGERRFPRGGDAAKNSKLTDYPTPDMVE